MSGHEVHTGINNLDLIQVCWDISASRNRRNQWSLKAQKREEEEEQVEEGKKIEEKNKETLVSTKTTSMAPERKSEILLVIFSTGQQRFDLC